MRYLEQFDWTAPFDFTKFVKSTLMTPNGAIKSGNGLLRSCEPKKVPQHSPVQCGDRAASEHTLAEKLALHHGRNRAVFEPATQKSKEQDRELLNTSSKELRLARPVPNRLRSKVLHTTDTVPGGSPNALNRKDSKSSSGPLL